MFCPNSECPDVKRTGLPGEYRPGIHECPRCKTTLVAEKPTQVKEVESFQPENERQRITAEMGSDSEEREWANFVSVAELPNVSLVAFAKSLLDGSGIRYFIKNEAFHRLEGFATPLWIPEVLVEPGRAEEARRLLARLGS